MTSYTYCETQAEEFRVFTTPLLPEYSAHALQWYTDGETVPKLSAFWDVHFPPLPSFPIPRIRTALENCLHQNECWTNATELGPSLGLKGHCFPVLHVDQLGESSTALLRWPWTTPVAGHPNRWQNTVVPRVAGVSRAKTR